MLIHQTTSSSCGRVLKYCLNINIIIINNSKIPQDKLCNINNHPLDDFCPPFDAIAGCEFINDIMKLKSFVVEENGSVGLGLDLWLQISHCYLEGGGGSGVSTG